MTPNVLELKIVRFETLSTETLITKLTAFLTFAKQNNFFPEGTAFANAYTSARIFFRYCYLLPI